jgi:hypothetical protein
MNYQGKLYGKVGKKYIELESKTGDWDKLASDNQCLMADKFADKVEINHLDLQIKDLENALRLKAVPYQRLLGEYEGTLKGILAWDIPEELKEKLRLKIKDLESKCL